MTTESVDLHIHTTYSDGVFTPEEVVQKALKMGLKAIAITDHDCVDGVPPAAEAAEGTGLEVVPGVEISSSKDGTEVHILGYFIDWQNPGLVETLRCMRQDRVIRMRKMVQLLGSEGVELDVEKVFGGALQGTAGRLHLARVMVEENIVRDIKEAFDRYIGDGKPCYVRHTHLGYKETIEMIKKAGGVPVLAHPGTKCRDEDIPDYVEAGLKGIEAFHSRHRGAENDKYLRIAAEYGLLITGGSDCHGAKKGEPLLGTVKVGYEVVEDLRKEAEREARK